MDPAIVGSDQFGQLFNTALPGNYNGQPEQIFSQPLVYTPSSGTKQYVYWATTQNNLYKMDAKTGEIVASRNLHIPFLSADLDGCVDINPHIGVTATGVIDASTDTLYLTAKTYLDQKGGDGPQGRAAGRYYVHAINVDDLTERENFPIDLEGTVPRNNEERVFNAGVHHQRPGLLHTGDFIYAGFASHCVQYNFTGFLIGWHKTTGKIVERYTMEGKGVPSDIKGGGIWMSGGGLTSDDAGSVWFGTGNGYASQLATIPVQGFNPPTSLEEAAVHMTQNADGSLDIVDFFMPWEKQALDGADKDLGTTPLELLPSQFQCGDTKRIGVITGKSGKTYFLNMDNLGGYRNSPNHDDDDVIQVYQNENSVYAGAGVYPLEGGYVYINIIGNPTRVFKFACNNGKASFVPVAYSPDNNAAILGVSHGTTTSLDGQEGTGLFWVTDVQGLELKVFDAVPKGDKLNLIKSFSISGVTKFTRAVFGDGIVYVGTTKGVVYGYGAPVNVPMNCTTPVQFAATNLNATTQSQTITCKANIGVTVTGVELSDPTNFNISNAPKVPLQLNAGDSFSLQASFHPSTVGLQSADVIFNTTNSEPKYSIATHSRLVGTGQSVQPLLDVSPNTVTFQGIVTGEEPGGVERDINVNNRGTSQLTIQKVMYATNNSGPYETWDGKGNLVVGQFSIENIPTTIEGNQGQTVSVRFNSSTSGTFSAFLKFVSNGGTKSVSIAASSGPAAKALLEFQTIDGTGWVKYEEGTPFTFGNVTENTSLTRKFRITNISPPGGVKLSLTVSKPPFDVAGLVRVTNQVDLVEGTSLAPGESGTAPLICGVPKSQWNVDPYNSTSQWTLNTNDPHLGKQYIQFFCNAVSEQAPPLGEDGQAKYRYLGCYKENNPGRQLQDQLYGDDNNTIAMCVEACNSKNWAFCGAQYHRECWGGNVIPKEKVDDANCNFDCSGDLNQICGGNGMNDKYDGSYISLFGNGDVDPSKPSPGGPYVNPGVDGYTSIGCYTESTTGRALPNGANTDKKTVAQCVDACAAMKQKYAGVEYGGECWCGDQFTEGAVKAPIADCNMPCNDNSTEYCGGPSRLNVYQMGDVSEPSTTTTSISTPAPGNQTSSTTTPTPTSSSSAEPTPTGPTRKQVVSKNWHYQGCWTEADNGRALPDKTYADDDMTLESCAKFCDGLAYFGVEYGRECYCGETLATSSTKAKQEDCSFLCPGDQSEYCGAGVRLDLYKFQASNGTKTETPSGTPTAEPTSTDELTSVDEPTTPTTPTTPAMTDSSSTEIGTATPTPSETESSSEEPTPSDTKSTSEESTPAPSSSVTPTTSSSSSAAPTPTGPSIYPGNANFTFYHCMSEPSSGRLLLDQVWNDGKNMTIDRCLQKCSDASTDDLKYNYAGVEYGRECWCGDKLRLDGGQDAETPGKNVTNTECDFLCPGNSTQYCGAGVRLSLYVLKDLVKAQTAKQ